MSPEDLFRFFFNGGGGGFGGGGGPMGGGFGGPFGGGGGFQFYGPGGIRMQTGGMGGMPRGGGQAGPQEPQTPTSTLLQIAPLLLFLFISVITQLPSLFFGSGSTPLPEFSFDQTTRFPVSFLSFIARLLSSNLDNDLL
jgi:DnaJ family protein B protein 12